MVLSKNYQKSPTSVGFFLLSLFMGAWALIKEYALLLDLTVSTEILSDGAVKLGAEFMTIFVTAKAIPSCVRFLFDSYGWFAIYPEVF